MKLKKIQDKIGFSKLSLNEENKLIKKEGKIRKPKRECSKFNGIKKTIKRNL